MPLIATVLQLKTTYEEEVFQTQGDGGQEQEEAVQLMVRGMRRPVQLEGPEYRVWEITGRCGRFRHGVRARISSGVLNLLTNLHKLMETTACSSTSRLKVTTTLRMFIEVDNREPVKIGDLEKDTKVLEVVSSSFSKAIFPECARPRGGGRTDSPIRRGGRMLRAFINTTNVGDSGWGPPLVDEDWHAVSQAIYMGVGVGELVLQVCGDEQGRQCSQPR